MPAYLRCGLAEFLKLDPKAVVGRLESGHARDGYTAQLSQQTLAWAQLIPLLQQERVYRWVLLALMTREPLPLRSQRDDWHDTSKTRRHTRPTASAAGWPCRFSPGTVTTPGHV